MNSQPKLKKGKVTAWYIVAILALIIAVACVMIVFVPNLIVENNENAYNFFQAINPISEGYYPFSGEIDFLQTVGGTQFLALLGANGFGSDATTLAFQLCAYAVLLILVIFLLVQIVSFIRKKRCSYFIHTIFGIVGVYFILCILSFLSYFLVKDTSSPLYSNADAIAFFNTYTPAEQIPGTALNDPAINWAYWTSYILDIVAVVCGVLFVFAVFYLACYITHTSNKVNLNAKEEVAAVNGQPATLVTGSGQPINIYITPWANEPVSNVPPTTKRSKASTTKTYTVDDVDVPIGVPLDDGTVVCTSKKGEKRAKKDGLTPVSLEEAKKNAAARGAYLKPEVLQAELDEAANAEETKQQPTVVQNFYGASANSLESTPKETSTADTTSINTNVSNFLTKEQLIEILDERDAKKQKEEKVDEDEPLVCEIDHDELIDLALSELDKEYELVDYEDVKNLIISEVDKSFESKSSSNVTSDPEEIVSDKSGNVHIDLSREEESSLDNDSEEPKLTTPIVVAVPSDYPCQKKEEAKEEETKEEQITAEDVRDLVRSVLIENLGDLLGAVVPCPPCHEPCEEPEDATKVEVEEELASKEESETTCETSKEETSEEEPNIVVEVVYEDEVVEKVITKQAAPKVETVATTTKEEKAPEAPIVEEKVETPKVEETKAPVVETPVQTEPVETKVEETPAPEVKTETVEESAPTTTSEATTNEAESTSVAEEAPIEEASEPTSEVEPQPVVKKTPIIPQKEVRGKEALIEKGEVVKQSFEERIIEADDEIKNNYQSLKALLLSYGLNSRVSSTGDTFRLSKKTYCKITLSGTAIKIYLALDPKSYVNSAIPINDSSGKDAYKQIPLGFRVKSDLSLRRARDLIIDCMNQNGLVPLKDFEEKDYVAEIRIKLAEKKVSKGE